MAFFSCPAETYSHSTDTEDKIDTSNEQLHDQSLTTVPSPVSRNIFIITFS